MRLVAVVHSMVRNMAPFGGTCVVYLHPYIPNPMVNLSRDAVTELVFQNSKIVGPYSILF